MGIDSSIDKVLERRKEVETQLSKSAELSSREIADFSRELSELRPVCQQIELVRALESELKDAITMVAEAVGDAVTAPDWQLLELGLASSAGLMVTPLQDLLHLDDAARFNTPGTVGGNWTWRLRQLDQAVEDALKGYGERGSVWGRR